MGDWLITDQAVIRKSDIVYIHHEAQYIRAESPTTENGSNISTILVDEVDREDAIGYLEKYLEELGNHPKWVLFRDWKILLDKSSLGNISVEYSLGEYKIGANFYSKKYSYTFQRKPRDQLDQLAVSMKVIGGIFRQQADQDQWLISDFAIFRKSDIIRLILNRNGDNYSIYCYFKNTNDIIYLYRNLTLERATTLLRKHGQELAQIGMTKSAGKRKN